MKEEIEPKKADVAQPEETEEEETEDDEEEVEVEETEEDEESVEVEAKKVLTKIVTNKKLDEKSEVEPVTSSTSEPTEAAKTSATTTPSTVTTTTKTEEKLATSSVQGESLLLPLLQGLLHKKSPQHQQSSNSNKRDLNVTLHSIEDSGTESGEDLKLLAAGLHDHIAMHHEQSQQQTQAGQPKPIVHRDLLTDVSSALNRLQSSLLNEHDVDIDKRNGLLSLVSRLQTGLLTPEKITAPTPAPGASGADSGGGSLELSSPETGNQTDRRPAAHGRFAKRRNRQNRHTVGVSQEELADARRYIEELVLMENLSNCGTPPDTIVPVTPPANHYILQKQTSAGAVLSVLPVEQSLLFRPNQFVPKPNPNPNTADTVVVQMRDRKPKYKFMRQSLSYEQTAPEDVEISRRPFSESISMELPRRSDDLKSTRVVQSAVQSALSKNAKVEGRNGYSSEEEEDEGTTLDNSRVSVKNTLNKTHHATQAPPAASAKPRFNAQNCRSRTPPGRSYETGNSSENEKPLNKFNSKKLKMKRANTIDIPKPQQQKEESGNEDESDFNSSVGLKRAIAVGEPRVQPKKVIPTFQPKTENDHKFLAFIQKQNSTNGLGWVNPNKSPQPSNSSNWSNAFGNIKSSFETARKPPPSTARNFWKNNETPSGKPCSTKSLFSGSKFSSSLNGINKVTATANNVHVIDALNIVNGSLAIVDGKILNGNSAPPSKPIIAQKPIQRNEFSHAPASAFKPIARTMEIPAFKPIQPTVKPAIPIPKPIEPRPIPASAVVQPLKNITSPPPRNLVNAFQYSAQQTQVKSPTIGIPWANKTTPDNRVLKIAASKFDVKTPPPLTPSLRTNSMRFAGTAHNLPAQHSDKPRLQQKRGSLPNESYNYFSEPDAPNVRQTEMNTHENENFYNYRPKPQKLQQSAQYSAPSLPNLVNEYRDAGVSYKTNLMYQPPHQQQQQQQHQQRQYQQQQYQPQQYHPQQYQPQQYQPQSYSVPYQQQTHEQRPLMYPLPPPPAPQLYYQQPPHNYYQPRDDSPVEQTKDYSFYPYTCTDYTEPCVSTYMPRVNVSNVDPIDSITNPAAEPLILHSARPIISPAIKSELKVLDSPSYSSDHSPLSTSVSPMTVNDPMELEMDTEIYPIDMQEYTAKTQVMKGPISQTAVTVANKTSRVGDDDDGKDSMAARNLQSILKGIKPKSTDPRPIDILNKYKQDVRKQQYDQKVPIKQNPPVNIQMSKLPPQIRTVKAPIIIETPSTPNPVPSHVIFNNVSNSGGNSNYPPPPSNGYNGYQQQQHSYVPNVVNGSIQIPFATSMFQNDSYRPPVTSPQSRSPVGLSKSDSWTQICQANNKPPSPHNFADGRPLQRTKSGHTLSLPKPFEAAIRKTEISEKERTVAAYFSGEKSPQSLSRSSSQQNINELPQSRITVATVQYGPSYSTAAQTSHQQNSTVRKRSQVTRIKSSEKASIGNQLPSSGLARSHTMPHIVNANFLDESNPDDAFEDLFNESMS